MPCCWRTSGARPGCGGAGEPSTAASRGARCDGARLAFRYGDEAPGSRHRRIPRARDATQEGRGGRARRAARAADRERADGRHAVGADAAARQPEGRIRLPRLRVAGGGQAACRRVLRERGQGRRRGGDASPRRSGVLRRALDRRAARARRLVARPARAADASDAARSGGDPLPSGRMGRGARARRRRAARSRRPGRGGVLHVGPHVERGRVPLPAARARAGDEQPPRLLEHVPRVVGLCPHRDDRDRQGHGVDRRHPPGGPAHRRRAESWHQPSAHAVGPREGQAARRHDHRREPAARGGAAPLREPADGPRRRVRRDAAGRRLRADPPGRRPGAVPGDRQAPARSRGARRGRARPRVHRGAHERLRRVPRRDAGCAVARAGGRHRHPRRRPAPRRRGGPHLEGHHRVLGDGAHAAQALRRDAAGRRERAAAAGRHRAAGRGRVPGARALERAGRPHGRHLREAVRGVPVGTGSRVRVRGTARPRLRHRRGHPGDARRACAGLPRHGRQLRVGDARHRGGRGGHGQGRTHGSRVDQAQTAPTW